MGSESTLSSHSAGNKVPGTKENSGSVELTQEQAGHSALASSTLRADFWPL